MSNLSMTCALLYTAALALTVLPRVIKKGAALSYAGGLCWAAGTVLALVAGARPAQVLVCTLALAAAAGWGRRRAP